MEIFNSPNLKPEQKLLRIIIISTITVFILGSIFFFVMNLLPSKDSKAGGAAPKTYYCSGSVLSSANKTIYKSCVNGDTIYIKQGMKIDAHNSYLKTKDVIIIVDSSEMNWSGDNYFYIGTNGKFLIKNKGKLTAKNCNTKAAIYFNTTKIASCGGGSGYYSFDQINNYGGIAYSGLTVLPVKLISFNAKYNKEAVTIDWTTATEINNSHFEIQRSNNKKDWVVVGTVKGNGNSTTTIKYSFSDKVGKLTGEIYYRLNQIDFDGKNELSNIRVVSLNNTKLNIGKVYPNPANDFVKVNINTEGDYTIRILDINGKEMLKQNGSSNIETLNIADIPAGTYLIKIENDIVNESHRIIIKH